MSSCSYELSVDSFRWALSFSSLKPLASMRFTLLFSLLCTATHAATASTTSQSCFLQVDEISHHSLMLTSTYQTYTIKVLGDVCTLRILTVGGGGHGGGSCGGGSGYINYQADMWMMLANVRKGEYITLNAYLIEILKKVSKCQSCSNRFLHNSLRVLRSSLLCILYSLTLSNNTDMSALRKSLCKPRPPW